VTEWPHFSFTLVPQIDRRQIPDRRSFWRGSRRACDMVASRQTIAPRDSAIVWTTAQREQVHATAGKSYLN
jgi:hypothetical protein